MAEREFLAKAAKANIAQIKLTSYCRAQYAPRGDVADAGSRAHHGRHHVTAISANVASSDAGTVSHSPASPRRHGMTKLSKSKSK